MYVCSVGKSTKNDLLLFFNTTTVLPTTVRICPVCCFVSFGMAVQSFLFLRPALPKLCATALSLFALGKNRKPFSQHSLGSSLTVGSL